MSRRILGVNGIYNWSWSKNSFTDKLLQTFENTHEVVDVKYPFMLASFAYFDWCIKRRAKIILEANKSESDILIAHSFGCLAARYAMEMGAKFDKVFFFGAADEMDSAFPKLAFNELFNIYSPTDSALMFGGAIPFHKFGHLGKHGYLGHDSRIINVKAEGMEHGDYVLPRHICDWNDFIQKEIAL